MVDHVGNITPLWWVLFATFATVAFISGISMFQDELKKKNNTKYARFYTRTTYQIAKSISDEIDTQEVKSIFLLSEKDAMAILSHCQEDEPLPDNMVELATQYINLERRKSQDNDDNRVVG